jgi:hypothetical protein
MKALTAIACLALCGCAMTPRQKAAVAVGAVVVVGVLQSKGGKAVAISIPMQPSREAAR